MSRRAEGGGEARYTTRQGTAGLIGALEFYLDGRAVPRWEGMARWGEVDKRRLVAPDLIFGQDALKRIMDGEELSVEYRLATSEDLERFVIPKWLESYSRSLPAKFCRADARHSMGREVYWTGQRRKIDRILSTSGVKVIVGYLADTYVAFAVEDRAAGNLHYCYVREPFRRQGIAKQLCGWIEENPRRLIRLTHLPPPWYTKPVGQGGLASALWSPHVVIDIVGEA